MSEAPEEIEFDVVIVGAGPAGLACAIKLKQLNPGLSVVILEKGGEVGAHILSGAVIDPAALDQLLPGWREEDGPTKTAVTQEQFLFLTRNKAFSLPGFFLPKILFNHGNYALSLGSLCRWLAARAEELGVEIYTGFAAAKLKYNSDGAVAGVVTGDMGKNADGSPSDGFMAGVGVLGKYVVLAEGARGSLGGQVIKKFDLERDCDPQKYGIGFKELWRVEAQKHHPGRVQHTFGWPLGNDTGGGSFLYHLDNNQVAVGFVVHLNYKNPYLDPFAEFQRFKTHPKIAPLFKGGERLGFGSRALSEGGFQSVPKLSFPGGVLVGDNAGFMNVARIKGSHNAIFSGCLAAGEIADALALGRSGDELSGLDDAWRASEIGQDLKSVRNVKPLWSRFGTMIGIALGGVEMWLQQLFGFSPLGTMRHKKRDHAAMEPASLHRKIIYPRPDGVVSFDRPSSLYLANISYREGQPVHLLLSEPGQQEQVDWAIYAGPGSRYCPAGVYEWVGEGENKKFVINAQNCLHCKTCDIKDPAQNITWSVPEGGSGPSYPDM